jgi:hypothetical protein
MLNLGQIAQKCLYVRGNEIDLEVLCQLEKFQFIGQGQSKILLNNISGALWNVHHFNVVWFIVILHRKYSQRYNKEKLYINKFLTIDDATSTQYERSTLWKAMKRKSCSKLCFKQNFWLVALLRPSEFKGSVPKTQCFRYNLNGQQFLNTCWTKYVYIYETFYLISKIWLVPQVRG